MPIVIFRERGEALYAYIAKQDLEARVLQVEHDETDRWGMPRLRIDWRYTPGDVRTVPQGRFR